jgi:hypothetical protein
MVRLLGGYELIAGSAPAALKGGAVAVDAWW